jgi:hypothetical protein
LVPDTFYFALDMANAAGLMKGYQFSLISDSSNGLFDFWFGFRS